jgi:hypothetical protein
MYGAHQGGYEKPVKSQFIPMKQQEGTIEHVRGRRPIRRLSSKLFVQINIISIILQYARKKLPHTANMGQYDTKQRRSERFNGRSESADDVEKLY